MTMEIEVLNSSDKRTDSVTRKGSVKSAKNRNHLSSFESESSSASSTSSCGTGNNSGQVRSKFSTARTSKLQGAGDSKSVMNHNGNNDDAGEVDNFEEQCNSLIIANGSRNKKILKTGSKSSDIQNNLNGYLNNPSPHSVSPGSMSGKFASTTILNKAGARKFILFLIATVFPSLIRMYRTTYTLFSLKSRQIFETCEKEDRF